MVMVDADAGLLNEVVPNERAEIWVGGSEFVEAGRAGFL
jgi:hypothetical protein